MGSLSGSKIELLIRGERSESAKMVSAMLALYDKETIDIHAIQCHPKVVVEEFEENGEKLRTIHDVIGIVFNFIIFEQDGESVNPYLEKLRKQGERIVAQILPNGDEKKTIIIRPASYKQLELPIKQ